MINKAIFKKTLSDFTTLKIIAIYALFLLIPLIIFAGIASDSPIFSVVNIDLRVEYLFGLFSTLSFVWVCGIAIAILSAFLCSSIIAEEVSDRTILLLVTKPVGRVSIFISKFLAFIVAISLYSAISIIASIYVWASAFHLEVFSLSFFLKRAPLFFVYSLFVALLFGSVSAAISALSSSKIKSILPSILLLILAFFIFIQIRGIARGMDAYTGILKFSDIGYDFGNVYVKTLEKGGVRLIPFMQAILGKFTGVYEVPKDMVKIDYDQGVILPSLERLNYRSPLTSAVKLISFPALLIFLGLFFFSRRDIN